MSAQTIHKSQKVSKADVVFNIILYGICGLILLLIAYPLYFIIIASFSNPSEVSNGNVWLWPSQFTLDGYKELLRHGSIWMGYWNTILYTVVGTALGLIVNISAAYSLSRRDLVGRKLITFYFIFTMFFNGGLIPTYDAIALRHQKEHGIGLDNINDRLQIFSHSNDRLVLRSREGKYTSMFILQTL